uniref:Uncharacterized protein n=1 Tax=Cajanus cajan TaxID=3821 RepID=A0A151RRB5_CAJCA|nr:hypothetical protein KK1_033369 [Cajanus cajan]
MKKQADKHRRDVTLVEGDWVYLKASPYKWKSLAKRRNEKLSPRFYGPFQVLEKVGSVAYKLSLPADCKIHPMFHVSKLKQAVRAEYQPQYWSISLLLILKLGLELYPQLEDVLALLYNKLRHAEVLVKWAQLPDCDNSWETVEDIQHHFPDFHREDKVKLLGGSIDRRPIVKRVYTRHRRGDRTVTE